MTQPSGKTGQFDRERLRRLADLGDKIATEELRRLDRRRCLASPTLAEILETVETVNADYSERIRAANSLVELVESLGYAWVLSTIRAHINGLCGYRFVGTWHARDRYPVTSSQRLLFGFADMSEVAVRLRRGGLCRNCRRSLLRQYGGAS